MDSMFDPNATMTLWSPKPKQGCFGGAGVLIHLGREHPGTSGLWTAILTSQASDETGHLVEGILDVTLANPDVGFKKFGSQKNGIRITPRQEGRDR